MAAVFSSFSHCVDEIEFKIVHLPCELTVAFPVKLLMLIAGILLDLPLHGHHFWGAV